MDEVIPLIHSGETWAFVGDSDSGHRQLLISLNQRGAGLVSFRHSFRNLSNTTEFYYQQRFNSSDSEDAMTVRQHLSNMPISDGCWSLESVVGKLRLEHLLDEQVIKLSNGETKRLLIASALVTNPAMLLLDHPLTGLDTATRESFNDLIRDIIASGIPVAIACSASEIPAAVSHVAACRDGEIVFKGKRSAFDAVAFASDPAACIDDKLLRELISIKNAHQFQFIIQMRNVHIQYHDKVILHNINWEVRQGERWSVSGPNGAGKSTLLSLVNADNPQAYANDILLFDKQRGSGESIWDIKRETGFVSPELYQYFPTGTSCLQVIESGFYDTVGLFRASDPLKVEVSEKWMEFMQIAKYGRMLLSQVPASVQRLTLLARALVKSPTLLILDEPTQGLDQTQQVFFTALIDRICHLSDVTMIYVSHYREHIPPAVTKYLVLRNGEIDSMS